MEQTKFSKASSSMMYNNYNNVPTGNVGNNTILASGATNTIRNQHSTYSTNPSHQYSLQSFTEPQYMKSPYHPRSTGPPTSSGADWNSPPSQQRDSYNNGGSSNSVFTNNSPHQPSSNKNQSQQRNSNVAVSPPLHTQWKIGGATTPTQYGGVGSSGDSKDFSSFSPNYTMPQQVLMNFHDNSGNYRFSTQQQQQTNNIQSNPSVPPHPHYNQPPQQCMSLQPQNSIQNYRSVLNSARGNNNTSVVENSRGGYQNDQAKVSSQSSLMATPQPPPFHRVMLESNWDIHDQPKSWGQALSQQPPPQQQQFHPRQRPSLQPHPSTSAAHLQARGQRGNEVPPMPYDHWQQMSNGGPPLHRQPPTTSSHDQDIMVGAFGTWNPVDNERGGPRSSNNLKSTSRYSNTVSTRRDNVKYCPNMRQNKGTGRLWDDKKEKEKQQIYNHSSNNQQRNSRNTNSSTSTYNSSSSSTKLEQQNQKVQAIQSCMDNNESGDQNRDDEMKLESWLESTPLKWETKVVSEKSSQQQKKFVTVVRIEGGDSTTGNGEGATEMDSRKAACKHLYTILDRSSRIDHRNNKKGLLKKSPVVESSPASEDHSKNSNQKPAGDETEASKLQSGRPSSSTDTSSSNNHSSNNRKSTKSRSHQQPQSGKSKIPSLLSIVVPRPTVPHPPHFFPPLNNDYHHYGHGEPSWSSPFHHWRHPGSHGFGPGGGHPHHNMDHHPHHHPHHVMPPPANVTPFRDRGGSASVVPWYVYSPHHHGNVGGGGPPHHHHHRGPPPPPPSNEMMEIMRMREMEQNWYEEQLHQESEVMCPEDIFINRMIMNQKEATRCAAGLPPSSMRSPRMNMIMPPDILPRDWNHPAPANKAKQTLDDKHVFAKHAVIYPHYEELQAVNQVVLLTEGILKALSDQFVNEDHPLPKDDDEEDDDCGENEMSKLTIDNHKSSTTVSGAGDGKQANSKPPSNSAQIKPASATGEKATFVKEDSAGGEFGGGETNNSSSNATLNDSNQKEEVKSAEKKPKFQILKRPKRIPKKVPDTRPRVLCGVNRVGTLAKGLLIHGDNHVEMVLLCGSIPTKQLLERVLKHFPEQMREARADLDYVIEPEEAGFSIVAKLDFTVKVSVTLTSVSLKPKDKKSSSVTDDKAATETPNSVEPSEDNKPKDDATTTNESGEKVEEAAEEQQQTGENDAEDKLNVKEEDEEKTNEKTEKEDDKQPEGDDDVIAATEFPEDMLPIACQLEALSKLRHAKWFLARASQQDSCVVIIRILREMQVRVPLWAPLSCWALENLIYLALSSSNEHMSPGDAFRRVFEVIAGGILLPDGPGILDPCEKVPVDVLDCCTSQQLEEITRHAQKALSLITFRGIHQVLGMGKITTHHNRHPSNNNGGNGRNAPSGVRTVTKRQQANENTTESDEKDHPAVPQVIENNGDGIDDLHGDESNGNDVEADNSTIQQQQPQPKSSTAATEAIEEASETAAAGATDNNAETETRENTDDAGDKSTESSSSI